MEISALLPVVRPTLERYEYFLATEEDIVVVRLLHCVCVTYQIRDLLFLSRPGTTNTQFLFLVKKKTDINGTGLYTGRSWLRPTTEWICRKVVEQQENRFGRSLDGLAKRVHRHTRNVYTRLCYFTLNATL